MLHIPFKGNAPALAEVMAGRVSFTFFPMVGIQEQVQNNRLRVLAVATKERLPQFPDAQTMSEAGFNGFEETAIWLGLVGPAGIPPAITNRLHEEVRKALALPSVQARLQSLGAVPVGTNSQQFRQYLESDSKRWARVIKASGIKPGN